MYFTNSIACIRNNYRAVAKCVCVTIIIFYETHILSYLCEYIAPNKIIIIIVIKKAVDVIVFGC